MFRSMKFHFLSLLKRSEAWNFIFWVFWNVQKREFSFFEPSEMFRSMKFCFLSSLKRSEAWIFVFWALWNVQKHDFLFFEFSETFRSMNFYFLSFLKCSEVWFSDFRPFWNVQKRVSCVNDYIKLGKSTLSMRRKALYLLYKAFQTTK